MADLLCRRRAARVGSRRFSSRPLGRCLREARRPSGFESLESRRVLDAAGFGDDALTSAVCLCPVCSGLSVQNAAVETLEAATATSTASISLGTSLDLSKTFLLHSNPTANHTIYLDFDGFSIASTPWENGGALSLKPFYADLTSLTTQTEIQRIWQRVAEDYAPFNVNVTTQQPNVEDLRKTGSGDSRWGIRVAFTYNTNLLTGLPIANAGGGGTAYYDSFNWSTDDVALVFNRGEYAAAETASHETGHALNLSHDGGTYGSNAEYYEGHGGTAVTSWGTIMGAPFINGDENITTWSKGEYIGANNKQDDLATITTGNGFTYRTDDHGSSFGQATALAGTGFSTFGVIERPGDIDVFRFDTGAGTVSIDIVNAARVLVADGTGGFGTEYLAARGPNLDISASLYRADGTLVATSNPLDQITAGFSLDLAAGTYYVTIDGVGVGNPLANPPTGYTEYGSLGQYLFSGSVQAAVVPPAIVVGQSGSLVTTEAGGTASFTVSLATAPVGDVVIAVTSSNTAETVVSPALLTFTAANWATPQTVTLTGVDDTVVDGNRVSTISLVATSVDAAYNGLRGPALSVTNTDNDVLVTTTFTVASGGLQDGVTYTTRPSVQGTTTAVNASDNQRLAITEGLVAIPGGKGKQASTSALQSYVWTFNNLSNATALLFEGYRTANSQGDNFLLQVSTDGGGTWTTAVTVTNTAEASVSVALAAPVTGTALVRAIDSNRNGGATTRDTLYVDRLLFTGQTITTAAAIKAAAGDGSTRRGRFHGRPGRAGADHANQNESPVHAAASRPDAGATRSQGPTPAMLAAFATLGDTAALTAPASRRQRR